MFFRMKQQIIIFIAAGVMLMGFVFFVYLPLEKKMKAVKSETAMTRVVIEEANSRKKQLPVLEKQFQQMQSVTKEYELNMPEKREIGSFLHQIANLMTEHNLSEQVIVPGREINANGLNCIPINMKCKGRLVRIFEFYKQLQRLDRLVRIEQSRLLNDNDFSGQVSMETKAVIYYRAEIESGKRNMDDFEKI